MTKWGLAAVAALLLLVASEAAASLGPVALTHHLVLDSEEKFVVRWRPEERRIIMQIEVIQWINNS